MEQNAILQRELNLARQSISGTSAHGVPSTSVAFVGGPEVLELGRNEIGFSTPIGGAIALVPRVAALTPISLCACSGHSGVGEAQFILEPSIIPVL